MITDIFSHKIHLSDENWSERLFEFARLLSNYDGQEYDRGKIAMHYGTISRRWSSASSSDAAFRNVGTAYFSRLGICHICHHSDKWIMHMTKAAKEFLLSEAPDASAFVRVQLPLFQLPLPMGIIYRSNGKASFQGNARRKLEELVHKNVLISPVRLLCVALQADCIVENHQDIFDAIVTVDELYTLLNLEGLNQCAKPNINIVADMLNKIRRGAIPLVKGERRLGLLRMMGVFEINRTNKHKPAGLQLLRAEGSDDRATLKYFNTINKIPNEFKHFTSIPNVFDPKQIAKLVNAWANYYDGCQTLPYGIMQELTADSEIQHNKDVEMERTNIRVGPIREFSADVRPHTHSSYNSDASFVIVDPEAMRIKQERRNIVHAEMVSKMCRWLEDDVHALTVGDTMHIDLWAKLASGEHYIFEIKSGGDGIFVQIRKAISQLYEYRYRYKSLLENPKLCLVVPDEIRLKWIYDYCCRDRDINLCMLSGSDDKPIFHELSKNPISW